MAKYKLTQNEYNSLSNPGSDDYYFIKYAEKLYKGSTDITDSIYAYDTSFTITTNITNGTYSGATSITICGTSTVILSATTGYGLPSSITVTNASYTYNSSTGMVSLSNPTGNVSISCVCLTKLSAPTDESVSSTTYSFDPPDDATSIAIYADSTYLGEVTL